MIDILIRYWYRQQSIIEELWLYKFLIAFVFALMVLLTDLIVQMIGMIGHVQERFLIMNMIFLFYTQYNLPIITEIIKSKPFKTFYNLDGFVRAVVFNIIKKNMMLPIFFVSIATNMLIDFRDYSEVLVLCLVLSTQLNMMLIRMVPVKEKIIFGIMTLSSFFICDLVYIMPIASMLFVGLNSVLIIKFFGKIIIINKYSEVITSKSVNDIGRNRLSYILTYYRRMSKMEYLELLIMGAFNLLLIRFSGLKYAEYMLIILAIAQAELIIHKKQVNIDITYKRYHFYEVLGVEDFDKFLHSAEFKQVLLEIISVLILFTYRSVTEGFSIYMIIWAINLILLMFLYTFRLSTAFFKSIKNKVNFKTGILTISMIYAILIITNIDMLLARIGVVNSLIAYEIIKSSIILTLCILSAIMVLYRKPSSNQTNNYGRA